MKPEDQEDQLDRLIRKTVGRDRASFDFERWRHEHGDSVREFQTRVRESRSSLVLSLREFAALHRRSVIRLAGLAAIVVFAFVCLDPFSSTKGGIAFGQILENMTTIRTFHAKVDQDGKEGEIWAKRPNMLRIEGADGDSIEISNGPTMWSVNVPFNKVTKKSSHYFSSAQKQGLDVIDYFIQMQCDAFEGFLSEEPVNHVISEGKRLDVYRTRFSGHGYDMSFVAWVDGETHLIHSLTLEYYRDGELAGQFSLSGIEYNSEVADSLFSFQPPEKMRVIVEEPKSLPVSELAGQGATLSGVVTWASNGKPVKRARLTVSGGRIVRDARGRQNRAFSQHVETDRAGYWRVSGVPEGHIAISIREQFEWPAVPLFTTNIGSLDRPAVIVDGQGEYRGLNFRVYKPDDYYARVTVAVTDEDGRPVKDALAHLQNTEGSYSQDVYASPGKSQYSREDGRFDAGNIWPTIRPVTLQINPKDPNGPHVLRGVSSELFNVEPQKVYHFNIVLPYKRELIVRVVDPNGRPLQGVGVSALEPETGGIIYPLSGPRARPLLTDSDGKAEVSGLKPGEKVLLALRRLDPNESDQWRALALCLTPATAPLDRNKLAIEVVFDERPIIVHGRIRLATTVQRASVLAYVTGQSGETNHLPIARAGGDEGGSFVLRGLPAGNIRLLYSAIGLEDASREGEGTLTVERGHWYDIEFTEQGLQLLREQPIP
jgi:outer membrane lipoprotein-sorting protein